MEENENQKINVEETSLDVTEENAGIKISDDVIGVISGVAVADVPGVASMQGRFAGGIGEVLSGKKNLAKGIKVETEGGKVKIDVNIIVEYGSRIPDVAFEIQKRVKKAVEEMTGLKVAEVNVNVQGVSIESDKRDSTVEQAKEENVIAENVENNEE